MGGLSESASIMVVVAMGMGEMLHRFPLPFGLVLPDGGLLVNHYFNSPPAHQ